MFLLLFLVHLPPPGYPPIPAHYKSDLALPARANARFGHSKFLKAGVPRSLSSVSSTQAANSDDGVLVSRYAYTPSSLRILRETYESASPRDGNRWWCYDRGSMAVAYGRDGDIPVQTYAEGVSRGEHIALAEWSGGPAQMSKFFLQDAEDSLIEIRDRTNLTLTEWRQYDYYGVLTRFDPASGNPHHGLNDTPPEWGWAGKEEMFELDPTKVYGSFHDPVLEKRRSVAEPSFFENWDGWEDVETMNKGDIMIPDLKCGKKRFPRPGIILNCDQ